MKCQVFAYIIICNRSDCDHSDSGGNAASGVEFRPEKSMGNKLPIQYETGNAFGFPICCG